MNLEQGQIWRQGEMHYRIVHWARMSIEYKAMKDPLTKEGTLHQVSKKEFCRLIKGAVLLSNTKPVATPDVNDNSKPIAHLIPEDTP